MALNSRLVFNETYYLAQNTDVKNAIGKVLDKAGTIFTSGLDHFNRAGAAEGRVATPLFNVDAYKANNPDLADAGITTDAQLRAHFYAYGAAEGRNAMSSQVFNLEYYKAQNVDLVNAGLSDAQIVRHFYEYGAAEGRQATLNFSVAAYKAANSDLAGLSDTVARAHWYTYGAGEGRAFPQLAQSYSVAPTGNTVVEGNALTFTVTSVLPVTEATTFTYNITGDTNGGTLTASKAEDFGSLTGTVTIPAGSSSITFTVTPTNDGTAEGLEGFRIALFNSNLVVVAQSNVVAIQDGIASQTIALTAAIDTATGNTNNDTFTASSTTLSVFDTLDGAAGTDTLTVSGAGNVDTTGLTGLTVRNIETINFQLSDAASSVTANTTGWTGVTTVNATVGAKATLTLSDTTDTTITVSAIDVTNSAVATTGGRNVTITAVNTVSDGGDTTADITVTKATGTVNVTNTNRLAGAVDGTDVTVTGGTTVNVTQSTSNSTVNTTATQGNVSVTGTAVTTAVTVSQSAVTTAKSDVAGIAAGDVTVTDVNASSATAAGTIASVTLANFGTATLDSSALTTVIASGTGTALNIGRGNLTATPTANTLNLNLNGLTTSGAVTDTEAASDDGFTTIAITTASGNSSLATLSVADATAITVAGDKNLTITTLTAGALTSVANNGTGSLTISSELGVNVGYTGGSGADSVALGATTKAITLGAGDDTATVSASALGTGGSINGGDGTDTIALSVSAAATASGDSKFQGTISNFERLSLTGTDGGTVNLANLGGINHITVGGVTTGLTLNGATSGSTLVANTSASGTITAALNADGTNDSISVNISGSSARTHTNLTLTGFENVTFNTDDSASTPTDIAHVVTTLVNTSAKSITVAGDAGLNLGTFAGTALTSFNASAVTKGAVTYTTGNLAAAATLTGGAGNDTLNASAAQTASVTLDGNAGDDTLTGSLTKSSTLSGGVGNDSLTGGRAADTINGGDGTDTFIATVATKSDIGGSVDVRGVVINLGADALTQAQVFAATGPSNNGLFLSSAGSTVAANTAAYLFANESSTAPVIVDTLISIENATGTAEKDYIVGSAGANSLVGGSEADTINGGDGNDTLAGDAGADSLLGGAGLDSITGGADADTINGGAGNDTIVGASDDASLIGGDGTDTLQIGAAFDDASDAQIATIEAVSVTVDNQAITLADQTETAGFVVTLATASHKLNFTGSQGADSITGGDAADTIVGGTGNDTLNGGAGADTITGGTGVDSILGGAGNDTIVGLQDDALIDGGADTDLLQVGASFTQATDSALVNVESITLTTATTLVLTGQTEAFTITGDAGADSITAGSGADSITSSGGADTISGAAGNDTIAGVQANASIVGGDGTDTLQIGAAFDDANDAQIATIENVSVTADNLTITLADQTESAGFVVTLATASHKFNFTGSKGTDSITGGDAADTIVGAEGNDTLNGGAGADTITGGDGVDSILGGAGNDTIVGVQDDALLDGGADTDTLNIGAAFTSTGDGQIANVENVTITADNVAVVLTNQTEGFNVSLATSASHKFNFTAGAGNDTITGGDVADTIIGGAGTDSIVGGADADSLTGGEGADTITGGAGADAIVLTESTGAVDRLITLAGANVAGVGTNNGLDTVTGFSAGASGDVLDFSAISAVTSGTTAVFGTVTATNGNPTTASTNVLVLDDSTAGLNAADATALAALTTTFGANVQNSTVIIVYAASDNGAARVAVATIDAGGDITAASDLYVLTGVDVDNVTVANFTLA